jgi:hypothetical protein
LVLVLLTLTGNSLRLKGGTRGDDLTGAFLEFAARETSPGPLLAHLRERVTYEVFDRDDARNAEMAATAMKRIVFGSDAAAAAIHSLPHPVVSSGISFIDRRSEAWLEKDVVQVSVLRELLKVFAIYGQAGCTSPYRVVILNASDDDVSVVCNRLVELWPEVVTRKPSMHIASENVMASQWARALGWRAAMAPANAAVFAAGTVALHEFSATNALMCVPATAEQALKTLPANIQTIGYALTRPLDETWLGLLARSRALRFVPMAKMHHFGPVWDGHAYWKQCFEEIQVET